MISVGQVDITRGVSEYTALWRCVTIQLRYLSVTHCCVFRAMATEMANEQLIEPAPPLEFQPTSFECDLVSFVRLVHLPLS